MEIEIRRFIRGKTFLINFCIVVLCFLVGYILCKSIDKIENLEIGQLLLSEITVYSQLGFLIFPITIMLPFSNDYSQKNIFFYRLLGYDGVKYFWKKVCMIFISLSIPTVVCILVISSVYNNFEYFKISLFYMGAVLAWQILISSTLVFLFRNIIISYSINLFVWLATIFITVANKNLYFLAYFDASTEVYKKTSDILTKGMIDNFPYLNAVCIIGVIFILDAIIIWISRRRWVRNGI